MLIFLVHISSESQAEAQMVKKQCSIKQFPIEILIMINEMLEFKESLKLCEAFKIADRLAFQYHQYSNIHIFSCVKKIYDDKQMKVVNPNLAYALLKNSSFQSTAKANIQFFVPILIKILK